MGRERGGGDQLKFVIKRVLYASKNIHKIVVKSGQPASSCQIWAVVWAQSGLPYRDLKG